MLGKAKTYLEASQRLINTKDESNMSCSIAFSYYAVLLYMKFVLKNTSKRPISYDIQEWPEEDMHRRVLQEIENRIDDNKKGRDLKDRVTALHSKRVDADYSEQIFTIDDAMTCKSEAEALIGILRNLFGNLEPSK